MLAENSAEVAAEDKEEGKLEAEDLPILIQEAVQGEIIGDEFSNLYKYLISPSLQVVMPGRKQLRLDYLV